MKWATVLLVWICASSVAAAQTPATDPTCDTAEDRSERDEACEPAATTTTITGEHGLVVPTPGLAPEGAITFSPSASSDRQGASLTGASSPETTFIVDGLDVTDPAFGGVGLALPFEFLERIELHTMGAAPHLPTGTGGQVVVTTKSGTNRVSGSVFGWLEPAALRTGDKELPTDATIVTRTTGRSRSLGGIELGGPVVPDRAWWYAAVAMDSSARAEDRIVRRRRDFDQNGEADRTGDGVLETDVASRRAQTARTRRVPFVVKLSVQPAAQHQGTLAVTGTHAVSQIPGASGARSATDTDFTQSTMAPVAQWSSQLRNGKTTLRATTGWLRTDLRENFASDAARTTAQWRINGANLGSAAMFADETAEAQAACDDGADDPFPLIANCPLTSYSIGGAGARFDSTRTRWQAGASVTEAFSLAGRHALTLGGAFERVGYERTLGASGGETAVVLGRPVGDGERFLSVQRFLGPGSADAGICGFAPDGAPLTCRDVTDDTADFGTDRWAAHLEDTWSPTERLHVSAGLRYSEQHLEYGPFERAISATGPLVIDGEWAPRARVAVDPLGDGRGTAYAGFARSYERIPLQLNATALEARYFASLTCTVDAELVPGDLGATCDEPANASVSPAQTTGGELDGQYVDDWAAGYEHEVTSGVRVGAGYHRQRLGRAIDDTFVARDNAGFVLGHPPDATRRYDALILTTALHVHDYRARASYTLSRATGSAPGMLDENGGFAPHLSGRFDRADTSTNLDAPTPTDRRHRLAVDAWRTWHVDGEQSASVGLRVRAASGTPIATLGSPSSQVFLLPSGTFGTTPATFAADLQVSLRRELGAHQSVELVVSAFNLLDREATAQVFEHYTFDDARPIDGGTAADLVFLKAGDAFGETGAPARRNPDYGKAASSFDRRAFRVGLRLRF